MTGVAADVLDLELERVRLLVHRRILWLRAWWGEDPFHGAGALVVSDARADALARTPDPGAEAAFQREHEPAAALSEAIASLERELAAPTDTPLGLLEERFRLPRLDRDVLILVLAPELDPAFERLYAYVQDDATRRFATPRLAADLLGPGVTSRLAPDAPLRRLRLVTLELETDSGWASRPLRVDERVIGHLRGADRVDPRVGDLLRPVADPEPLGDAVALAARLTGLLADLAPWPLVQLFGPPRAGARGVAAAACAQLGLRLAALAPDAAARCQAEPELAGLLEREAALLGLALWLDDGGGGRLGLAERLAAPVLLGGEERLRTEARLLAVPLRPPPAAARRKLWAAALPEGVDPRPLADQFELDPAEISPAVAEAATCAALRGAVAPDAADVWEACRARGRVDAGGLARPIEPSDCWERLVLPEDAMVQLGELAAQAAHRGRVYEDWGFGERLARGRGLTALFAGPSGTGKTMAAEALASRLRLDMYVIDLAGVVSKWIGETEKNLRRIFDAAEHAGAVLFFDEADALFGKRTEVKDAHDRYANIEVDYLLQRMEDYRGVAILATNRRNLIDPAFLRRLRFLVDFPFPDLAARQRLWRGVFPPAAPVGDLDFEALARLEISGGSIRTIAVNAAFLAAAAGKTIGMDLVMRAARREYAKLERLIAAAEFGAWA
jgi:hypothetical protein